jgi:hypothetical protein
MTELTSTSTTQASPELTEISSQLESASDKKQLQLIPTILEKGDAGLEVLMEFLLKRFSNYPDIVDGKIYQILAREKSPNTQAFIQSKFPQGLVPLKSEKGADYSYLQDLLVEENFLEADKLTIQLLCELAGESAVKRKWLYFSEADNLPISDLQTINTLWLIYSEGKFGYSVQREIWLSVGKNWDKLWPKIGWKKDKNWTRYPQEFTWELTAPRGHLPLSNQLRGVRVINSLLSHPAWCSI